MTPHVKVYMRHFDYCLDEIILCERCGKLARDIHHINGRGRGKDVIENLVALCRDCHTAIHLCQISKEEIRLIHEKRLKHD